MFADPATVTIGGVANPLVRINQDKYSSEYLLRTSDEELRLNIRNTSYSQKKRNVIVDRHNVELIHTVFPVAPSTLSVERKSYFVIENQRGDDIAESVSDALGLVGFLTNANITKLMNFES
jgi:hypothetical protein